MKEKSIELKLCPNCGSTEYVENYPAPGVSICEECGHEITSVALKVIQDHEVEQTLYSKYVCPFCGRKSGTDDDVLFSDDNFQSGSIVVFKCSACGKLDGYRILPYVFAISEEVNDGDFDRKAVEIAKTEGHSIYSGSVSEKIGKALKEKEKDPMAICQNHFQTLVKEKSPKMLGIGVKPLTIDMATWNVESYVNLNGPFTEKQLEHLFSAGDELYRENVRVDGYKFTNATKKDLIENLSIMIENQQLTIPQIPELINELKLYGYKTTPSRNVQYGAPEGYHDDAVIALALAAWQLKRAPLPGRGAVMPY